MQYRLCLVGTLWHGSDSGKRQTGALTTTGRVQGEQYSGANNSKSTGDTRDFHKAPSRTGWQQGNEHVAQEFVRLQRRGEIGDEKLSRGQYAAAALTLEHKLRLQGSHHGRQLGGWVGMRQAAADGPALTYRRRAHVLQGVAQQGTVARH